ncbi:MAG TPA: GFA family protein [Methyloceanibacter sp.]|nr:GFA family protein [Methyloceanibacter sp.]
MTDTGCARERTARCLCGNLTVTARGEPVDVYACGCADCQRKSGSAFTYAAIYPESAVTIAGERRAWRRHGDSGRFVDNHFCPTCGVSVYFHAEGLPGLVGIAVGCFADAAFAKPARLYWGSRRHRWLDLTADVPLIETQSD